MCKLGKICQIARSRFSQWRYNSRIVLTFFLLFVMCIMLTNKVITFSYRYDTILQICEVFVWTFSDAPSVMLSTFLMFILFSDMPFINGGTAYRIYRVGRKNWIWGNLFYMGMAIFFYEIAIVIITILLSFNRAFVGNQWSETAAMIGYGNLGESLSLFTSIRAMEHSTPYVVASVVFVLVFLYMYWITTLMFLFSILKKNTVGIIFALLINLYGVSLNVDFLQKLFHIPEELKYRANTLFGWLSPLNHSLYYMHSFGYDRLPKLWMSIFIFICLIMVNFTLLQVAIRKYDFTFIQINE